MDRRRRQRSQSHGKCGGEVERASWFSYLPQRRVRSASVHMLVGFAELRADGNKTKLPRQAGGLLVILE
jgi:hypothetical protein